MGKDLVQYMVRWDFSANKGGALMQDDSHDKFQYDFSINQRITAENFPEEDFIE